MEYWPTDLICEILNCDKFLLINQSSDQPPNQRPTTASTVHANGLGEATQFMQHLCGVQMYTSSQHSLSIDCNLEGNRFPIVSF